jgi:hypothetical protein
VTASAQQPDPGVALALLGPNPNLGTGIRWDNIAKGIPWDSRKVAVASAR